MIVLRDEKQKKVASEGKEKNEHTRSYNRRNNQTRRGSNC